LQASISLPRSLLGRLLRAKSTTKQWQRFQNKHTDEAE
jgi:hypothetical protein